MPRQPRVMDKSGTVLFAPRLRRLRTPPGGMSHVRACAHLNQIGQSQKRQTQLDLNRAFCCKINSYGRWRFDVACLCAEFEPRVKLQPFIVQRDAARLFRRPVKNQGWLGRREPLGKGNSHRGDRHPPRTLDAPLRIGLRGFRALVQVPWRDAFTFPFQPKPA